MRGDGDHEAALKRLPDLESIGIAARDEFARGRVKIDARHALWRANMPSLEPLFDGDEHRAKALAGNLATHAGDLMGVWIDCEMECGGLNSARRGALEVELEAFSRRWHEAALGFSIASDWGADADAVFEGVLRDLLVRAGSRATDRMNQVAISGPSSGGSVGAAVRWLGAAVRRVFRPTDP